MDKRLKILGAIFTIGSFIILARLFFWQVLRAGDLSVQARRQHERGFTITAPRGSILASDESWLVTSKQAYLVYASKTEIEETPRDIANKLAPLFVEDPEDEEQKLQEAMRLEGLLEKDGVWIPLKHKVSPEIKKNIEAMEISGIGFDLEEDRMYPEASAAAHLLGFVGKDDDGMDKGYFGLEGFFDISLAGKPGFVQRESDARGIPILSGGAKEISAVRGVDLVTNIDKVVQLTVEQKLKEGMELYGAVAGTVIVIEPYSGAVKAMSSYPSFDPEKYNEFSQDLFKNPAISNTFEPGSIFKPFVMASALDAGAISPDTRCGICHGPVQVDKYTIGTWNDEYRADSTMTDVIVHSDNVGMVFVGRKLGKDRLYNYLTEFGFGQETGIDLQGEANSILRDKNEWSNVDLATATFGQGLAVTPIQIAKALATVANDGVAVTPHIVKEIQVDGYEEDVRPGLGKQVISKKAADQATEMMVQAVREGESKWIQAKGYKVAGKTGTAQIPIEGHYDSEKTIASFMGFAPADDPKFAMLVILREPQSSPWASETAAPLWFSIADDLFDYYQIQPES